MVNFFEYENEKLTLNVPELLLTKEFKAIYESDKSEGKDKAFSYFTFIWLMIHWKSPYNKFSEQERLEESLLDSGLSDKDVNEKMVTDAMVKFESIIYSNVLIQTMRVVEKSIIRFHEYFNTVNFTEKVESGASKGTLLFKPKEYMDVLKNVKDLIITIKSLNKQVMEELKQGETKVWGSQEKGEIEY